MVRTRKKVTLVCILILGVLLGLSIEWIENYILLELFSQASTLRSWTVRLVTVATLLAASIIYIRRRRYSVSALLLGMGGGIAASQIVIVLVLASGGL